MLYISFTIGKLNCPVVDLGSLETLGFGSISIAGDPASVWCGCVAREAFSFGWDFSVVGFDLIPRFARCGAA
jgi:hypothetical protein